MTFLFLLLAQFLNANMSSPYRVGTKGAFAVCSRNINILSEKIHIKIDNNFNEAYYTIEYNIKSDYYGEQVPLLFVAIDYLKDFKVFYDDKPVEVLNYIENLGDFPDTIKTDGNQSIVKVAWDKQGEENVYLKDLKFFKTDIQKGTHHIKVTYKAICWEYLGHWIVEKTFRYSLLPARYWKSFGTFELTIEQEGNEKYKINFDDTVIEEQIKTWKFNKIPSDYLKIELIPTISVFARVLLFLKPFFISLIPTLLLVIFHYRLTFVYRQKNLSKRFSIVVIIGSIIVPFLGFLAFMSAYDLIDYALGIYASRNHAYIFLVIIFYPIVLLFYWILFWLIDKNFKKKILLKNTKHSI